MDDLQLSTVFARNCEVRKIPKSVAEPFINANHRLCYCTCRHRYALFVRKSTGGAELKLPEGTMVAVATFSNPRNMTARGGNPRSFEWIRYASLAGVRVVGGMGKLLRSFVDDVHPDDVMTYVDSSESAGESYAALGFVCEGESGGRGYSDLKFRKNYLAGF